MIRRAVSVVGASLVLAMGGAALIASSAMASGCTTAQESIACQAQVSVTVPINTLTLTLSVPNIAMSDDGDHLTYNGTPNVDWNVSTNDEYGYDLVILGDSGSAAFVNTAHPAYTIPDAYLRIQTTVNGGATTSLSGTGVEYTSSDPSLPAGDTGSDLWLLRGLTSVPASGTYYQAFDYEAIAQ